MTKAGALSMIEEIKVESNGEEEQVTYVRIIMPVGIWLNMETSWNVERQTENPDIVGTL